MNKKLFLLIICIIILPSCKKPITHTVPDNKTEEPCVPIITEQERLILDKIIEQEALLVTLPIPLYDKRILPTTVDLFDSDTITLAYQSSLTIEQLIDFFISQMERNGWNFVVSFDSDKHLLIFENPDSYCAVELQQDVQHNSLIYIYIKRASCKARSQVVSWDE